MVSGLLSQLVNLLFNSAFCRGKEVGFLINPKNSFMFSFYFVLLVGSFTRFVLLEFDV